MLDPKLSSPGLMWSPLGIFALYSRLTEGLVPNFLLDLTMTWDPLMLTSPNRPQCCSSVTFVTILSAVFGMIEL